MANRLQAEKRPYTSAFAPEHSPGDKSGQLTLEFEHRPSHAEDDFLVTDTNRVAFGHILSFPHWASPLTQISGGPKTGKSHLARIWQERAHAIAATPDTIDAIAQHVGNAPVLIEDVDRLPFDEHALFHLLNQAIRESRPLLMTSRTPVGEWPYKTDDLKSRVRLAAQFDVGIGDDTELSQMFAKLFGDRQLKVDPKTIRYLVTRMERSPAEVVALADLMDRLALAGKSAITRNIAAAALALRAGQSEADQGVAEEEQEQETDRSQQSDGAVQEN